jgi:hypothetical protein
VIGFDPDLVHAKKRIFPFDTGAFANQRYTAWMHDAMDLRDFELTNLADAPQRYVSSFFGTNHNYLKLTPRAPPVSYTGHFEVDAMVSLLTDPNGDKADDRRLTLELQVQEPIPFDSAVVRALIIPRSLRAAPYIQRFLKGPGRGVEVRAYDAAPLKMPREYQVKLEEIAVQLQSKWGLR